MRHSKIPLWYANKKKDVCSPEEWVQSVEKGFHGSDHNDVTRIVSNALRDGALTWFQTLVRKRTIRISSTDVRDKIFKYLLCI